MRSEEEIRELQRKCPSGSEYSKGFNAAIECVLSDSGPKPIVKINLNDADNPFEVIPRINELIDAVNKIRRQEL